MLAKWTKEWKSKQTSKQAKKKKKEEFICLDLMSY